MVGAQHQGYQVVRRGRNKEWLERNTKATKLLEEGRNKEWLERNTKATKLLEEGRNT